jgi:hypothetical protein
MVYISINISTVLLGAGAATSLVGFDDVEAEVVT